MQCRWCLIIHHFKKKLLDNNVLVTQDDFFLKHQIYMNICSLEVLNLIHSSFVCIEI
jgi:hypothetical protein